MSDLFGKLKSGANKVAFEADKMNRANRAQAELDKIKGQISILTSKLGEMVYREYTNQEAVNPALAEVCKAIAGLQQQVSVKGEEIAKIKAEVFAPQGAAPAATPAAAPAPAQSPAPLQTALSSPAPQAESAPAALHCTNCGREIPAGVKFCPDCGTKVL